MKTLEKQPLEKIRNTDTLFINNDFIMDIIENDFQNFSHNSVHYGQWIRDIFVPVIFKNQEYSVNISYFMYYDEENNEIYNIDFEYIELFDKKAETISSTYVILRSDIEKLINKINN